MPTTYGSFRAHRILARTEYADVYQAEDDDGNRFALKVLRLTDPDDGLVDAMFTREIAALDGFVHPGVVPLRQYFRHTDGSPVLVFDLVSGGTTLATLLTEAAEGQADRSLDWRLREAMRVVDAVAAAHDRKVIHRDLKPGNILLDRDTEQLRVCDFGVANVLSHRVLHPGGRTLRDLYTRPFAAPEQRLHGEALYPADVYALSLVLTCLLGMCLPPDDFKPDSFNDLWEHARCELELAAVPQAIAEELCAVLRQGLSDDPEKRPTLRALAGQLAAAKDAITPTPTAILSLTQAATTKATELGLTAGDLAADLNDGLAIRLDLSGTGQRIKLYGRTTLAVAVWDGDDTRRVRLIDVKSLTGTQMSNDRRDAATVKLCLRTGVGSGSALVEAARAAQSLVQSARVAKLLELAQRVIDLEFERLPVLVCEFVIENGKELGGGREVRVTQAAGYAGAAIPRVRVRNAKVRVLRVEQLAAAEVKNLLAGAPCKRERIANAKVPSLFDRLDAMQLVDPGSGHCLGTVAQWQTDDKGETTAVFTLAADMELAREQRWIIRDKVKYDGLNQLDRALDTVRQRKACLSDLPELLTLTSAHQLGERQEIVPFQSFLQKDRRVMDIIERVLAATVSCVQGPPGTGKTTLIIELVLHLLSRRPNLRILVCSQANEAVANALERLTAADIAAMLPNAPWIVRDVREELRNADCHDGLEPMFRHRAAQWQQRAVTNADASGSQAVRAIVRDWCEDLTHAARGIRGEFAHHVQVWGATTARSPRSLNRAAAQAWDVVIVDEAAKITLAEVLVPLVDARRIVLIGDHKQLAPFLDSLTAEQLDQSGLDPDEAKLSLFQHLFERVLPPDHRGEMLTQSRMHPTIGSVVSKLFYDGRLLHNVKHEDRPLPAGAFDRDHRVLFLGFRGADEQTPDGSRRNRQEADQLLRVAEALDRDAAAAGKKLTVAVITPYLAQRKELELRLNRKWKALQDVRAGTVNTFQGRQADVVLYSLVRTGSAEWRFLADPRLFNVAMSRAKSLLVLVGDLEGAPGTPLMQSLIELLPAENLLTVDQFLAAK